MNGLQSLMQGMPQGQQGMPQGQQGMPQQGIPQGQQGTPMPNDPRMGAAMGLVDDSIEKFNLDPQTEALMLQNQALALLQAADNVGKMNAPQQDTNIKEQTTQGIAGMLQSLAPGMQQRGQQMQQSQARQMLGGGAPARPPMGGMPSMGAPNMARMANGGIVGFDGGGFLNKAKEWDTKLNQAHDRRQTERLARGKSLSDYSPLDPYNSLSNIMYDTGIAGAMQGLTGYKSEVQQPEGQLRGDLDPVAAFLETYKQLQADVERSFPEEKAAFKQRVIDFVNNSDPRVREAAIGSRAGMARGGIIGYRPGGEVKGYAGPNGSQVGYDYSKDPNLYAPTEIAQPDDAILEFARKQMQRDAGAEAVTAGERLRELTGAEDLMAQRTKAQEALQAQREARFNPEESKRRRWQAGLAGLAERGLGGFGAGRTAEMDKILGEKLSAAEASVADMDKLISELRELGMGQFEAEKQARDMVEKAVNQGLSTSAAVADSRQRAQDAAANRATQERGQDMTAETQRYVADANAARTSGPERAVQAIMADSVAKGIAMTETEAMEIYYAMQPSIYGVTQRGDQATIRTRQDVVESVDKSLGLDGDPLANIIQTPLMLAYKEAEARGEGAKFREDLINQGLTDLGLSPVGAPAGGSSTGPTEELTLSTVPTEGNLYTRNGVTYIYTNGAFTPQ